MKVRNKKQKAIEFLRKYQLGGINPLADDTLMSNPYDYAPDLQTAQAEQIVQPNNTKSQSIYIQPDLQQQKQSGSFAEFLPPFMSSAINLGIGVKGIVDSIGEKKRQKQYERAFKNDLDRRMNDMRINDYYHTPYQFKMEEGGSIPDRYKNMGFNRVGQKKNSTRDGKKWMVLAKKGDQYKVVHGGYEGMEDYTQHRSEQRRENFWNRMGGKDSAKAKDPFSPLHWHKKFGTWQQGGQLNQMDYFMDFYEQQQDQNQMMYDQFSQYYNQKNNLMRDNWQNKRRDSFKTVFDTTVGLAQDAAKAISGVPMMQLGGLSDTTRSVQNKDFTFKQDTTTYNLDKAQAMLEQAGNNPERLKAYYKMKNGADPDKIVIGRPQKTFSSRFREHQQGGEYDPRTDLYSAAYDPKVFLEQEEVVQNEISQAQIEDKEQSVFESWLFEDDDPYQGGEVEEVDVNESYFNSTNTQMNVESGDVISHIGQQESGGDYMAVNPYSGAAGKYQFLPSAWAGQIKSFMGLPSTYTRDEVMEAFKRNPEAQERFMQHVTQNVYMPEVEKVRGLARKYGLSDDQVVRLFHYRGISDGKRRLQTGDFSVSQEEKNKYKNPDILSYLNK